MAICQTMHGPIETTPRPATKHELALFLCEARWPAVVMVKDGLIEFCDRHDTDERERLHGIGYGWVGFAGWTERGHAFIAAVTPDAGGAQIILDQHERWARGDEGVTWLERLYAM